MSATSLSLSFGGRLYAQKWSLSTIRNQRLTIHSTSATEILKILISFMHIRRALYTELSDEIQQILTYCLTSTQPNCTPWVRGIAAILSEGGNGGGGFGVPPSILDPSVATAASALKSADQLIEFVLQQMVESENKELLASDATRWMQPHEAVYMDTAVLPAVKPYVETSFSSSSSSNPHFTVRTGISFDIVLPKEEELATTPLMPVSTSSSASVAKAAPKPLPSNGLFAPRPLTKPTPSGQSSLPAGGTSVGFQKRSSIQMLDLNEAQAAMDAKRRKTSATTMVPTLVTPTPQPGVEGEPAVATTPAVAPQPKKPKQTPEEKEAAKLAKAKEKEQKDAERKAAAEEKAALKAKERESKEAEKEAARIEREKLKLEKQEAKDARERERTEKAAAKAATLAMKKAGTPVDIFPQRPMTMPGAPPRQQQQLPPALMQALITSPQDPNTMAMFAAWQAQQQQQQQQQQQNTPMPMPTTTAPTPATPMQPGQFNFFPPPPGMQANAITSPFPPPPGSYGAPSTFPFQQMGSFAGGPFAMPGLPQHTTPMRATTVATIPGMQTQSMQSLQANPVSAALNEFPPPPPPTATSASEFPPPPASVPMETSDSAAAIASLPPLPPLPPDVNLPPLPPFAPPATIAAAPLSAPTPASHLPSAPSKPQPNFTTTSFEAIMAKSNKVSPEDRDRVYKFLHHIDFPIPASAVESGVYSVVLNEDLDVPDAKGQLAKESTVFEMTFATRAWRKLKKRKVTKAAKANTAAAPATALQLLQQPTAVAVVTPSIAPVAGIVSTNPLDFLAAISSQSNSNPITSVATEPMQME